MYQHRLGEIVGPPSGSLPVLATTPTNPQGEGWVGQFANSLANIGTVLVGLKAQDRLAKINIERAKQGLMPLTMDQAALNPTIKVQLDTPPEVKTEARQMLLYGALGGGALLLLLGAMKR